MSLYNDPNGGSASASAMIEGFIASEHWRPILLHALWIAAILVGAGALLGMPPEGVLVVTYFAALPTALINAHLALRIAELGRRDLAVPIGRRALTMLLLAGFALIAGRVMG